MLLLDGNDTQARTRQKINTNMEALEAVHTCTGFVAPNYNKDIGVAYDSTTRKVTLTGTFVAFYDGKVVPVLKSGWVSPPHNNVTGLTYYLRYDGTQFLFDTTPWTFGEIMIAYVQFGATIKVGIREVHGAGLSPDAHRNLHLNIGTTRISEGTVFSNYVLNSTTVANRKPYVDNVTLLDEDLQSEVVALTDATSYCWRYLTGSAVRTLLTGQSQMLNVLVDRPYYNQNVGGTWQQTLFPVNAYGAIFVIAVPVTSDAGSQAVRYMWVQPQTVSTDLGTIQKLTPSDVVSGDPTLLFVEYNFIGKIIIQYKSVNWELISVEELSGSRAVQVSATNTYSLATSTADGLMSSDMVNRIAPAIIPSSGLVALGTDCNVETREWHLGGNVGSSNYPSAGAYWYVNTIFYTTSRAKQIAYMYTGADTVYTRNLYNSVWSAWTKLASTAVATTSVDGLMSASDKTSFDDAKAVNGYVKSNGSGDFSAGGVATTSVDGLMDSGDKVIVDALNTLVTHLVTDVATGTANKGTYTGHVLLNQIIDLELTYGNTAVSPTIIIGGVTYTISGMPTVAIVPTYSAHQLYKLKKTASTTLTFMGGTGYEYQYVTEYGTDANGWYYERYSNRKAMCRIRHDIGSVVLSGVLITIVSGTAVLYQGTCGIGHNYPFTFSTVDLCITTPEVNGAGYAMTGMYNAGAQSLTAPTNISLMRINSASPTLTNVILCNRTEGTW